jgi:dihydrofolate reductase
MIEEVRRLKEQPGQDMTLLGSGSILTQLAREGLIDEYGIMIDPIALGTGTPLFQGLSSNWTWSLPAQGRLRAGWCWLITAPEWKGL